MSVSIEGFVAPGFERVREALAANFAAGEELGASFAAIRDDEILVNIWGGFADRASTRPWARDIVVPVFSATKGVSALVMAWLVDQGALAYDDLVRDVWPDFAARGKGDLTVAQVISHQAGVPGFAEPVDPAIWGDPPACAAAIAALEPMWPPGSASGYHPHTWGYIAAEIATRASGRTIGEILRTEICAPRGIDFQIGLPEKDEARCADVTKPKRIADFGETIRPATRAAFLQPWSLPGRISPEWRRLELPAANGHGTALALAQLYGFFATGGGDLISPAAFGALTERRAFGQDEVLPFRIDWRTGIMGNSNAFYGPNGDAFGHSGSGGSCGFGDPRTGVSAAYVMNKQSHFIMGDPRSLRLIEALYACLDA